MKKLMIEDASKLFPERQSQCCHAPIRPDSLCIVCGKPQAMPYYFLADHPIADAILAGHEDRLRSSLPVGVGLAMWVNA